MVDEQESADPMLAGRKGHGRSVCAPTSAVSNTVTLTSGTSDYAAAIYLGADIHFYDGYVYSSLEKTPVAPAVP